MFLAQLDSMAYINPFVDILRKKKSRVLMNRFVVGITTIPS